MSDPRTNLLRLISGFQVSQAINVAATLGLADALREGPRTASALARATGTHPDALHRLLRVLAAVGVLQPDGDHAYALSAMGEFLRRDAKGTCAPMAELFNRTNVWNAWGDLLNTIRTGDTAFDRVHGCNVWDYRVQHREEAVIFDRAMASGTARLSQAILDIGEFGRFAHVVDVGGGDGMFLANILERHPSVHGTLFDQPEVIARAIPALCGKSYESRLDVSDGNFFDSVPAGGDAYLLKWILHDWSDTAAVDILRSCRRSMTPNSRLLVAEYIIGPGYASPEGELMDLTMMVMNGGRERTPDEFAAIFATAGFRLLSVTRTATPLCLIEGVLQS